MTAAAGTRCLASATGTAPGLWSGLVTISSHLKAYGQKGPTCSRGLQLNSDGNVYFPVLQGVSPYTITAESETHVGAENVLFLRHFLFFT